MYNSARAMSASNANWYLLLAILAIAAILRLWGIDFGLPYDGITYDSLTIEEIQEVHRALKLGAGEYSQVFGKGGLYLILFLEYGVYFVVLWLLGWVDNGRDFAIQVLHDRTAIYVIGRVTVALMGVATCYVAYRIGRHLYGERTGLIAALFGAVSYFHAVFSGVINVDIGATLMLWLSLLVYLRFEETGGVRFLAGAGALAAVAIAFKFPSAVAIPLVGVALLTAPQSSPAAGQWVRNCAIFGFSLITALTVIAPEWIASIGYIIQYNFLAGIPAAHAEAADASLINDIKSITVMQSEWTAGYWLRLVKEYNLALTVAATFAAVMGLLRRNRWDLILTGLVIGFIGVMSLSGRTQPERYLLPIVPALWILGARGALALSRLHAWLPAAAVAVVTAMPTFWLIRAAVEKSHMDTRIHAKLWFEANVPEGALILMDGMRYRFSQGPPLNPDALTIEGKVDQAIEEGGNFGRGVSDETLSIYEEAMKTAAGPKYRLVSTVHGLKVRDLSYYAEQCFDYIVTSSMIASRFRPGEPAREKFPDSAKFYESLESDRRVHLVHEEVAKPWLKSGPTIRIYRVDNACSRTS